MVEKEDQKGKVLYSQEIRGNSHTSDAGSIPAYFPMSRTFSKVISEEELAQKLLTAVGLQPIPGKTAKESVEAPYVAEDDFVNGAWVKNPNAHSEFIIAMLHGDDRPPALSKFFKDVEKVQVDVENVESHGLHTLSNGLAYYAFDSGGDWELPVYMIVYWDGKSLRGYIPKDGNVWNTVTNKAYGNDQEDEEYPEIYGDPRAKLNLQFVVDLLEKEWNQNKRSDAHNIMTRFGLIGHKTGEGPDPEFDLPKIEMDILGRITYKP